MRPTRAHARRTISAIAMITAATAGLLAAGTATPAAAASPQCVASGCDLFTSPGSGLYFTTPGNIYIGLSCWTDAGWYAGTNRWFKINTVYGDGHPYVSADQVKNQVKVGHCP